METIMHALHVWHIALARAAMDKIPHKACLVLDLGVVLFLGLGQGVIVEWSFKTTEKMTYQLS